MALPLPLWLPRAPGLCAPNPLKGSGAQSRDHSHLLPPGGEAGEHGLATGLGWFTIVWHLPQVEADSLAGIWDCQGRVCRESALSVTARHRATMGQALNPLSHATSPPPIEGPSVSRVRDAGTER